MKDYFAQIDQAYDELTGVELEKRLLELAAQCREEFGERSEGYASILSELGGFYRGQRKLEKAKKAQCFALEILEELGRQDTADYATALNNLSSTYRLMQEFDKAKEGFQACLECYRMTIGEQNTLFASALNNLSLVHLDRNELEEAERLQVRAMKILEQIPDQKDEFAAALCNLGVLCLLQNKLVHAEEYLCAAIRLFEQELGTQTPHYHAAQNTLGLLYCRAEQYKKAAQAFQIAAEAAGKLYDKSHPEYQSILSNQKMVERLVSAE